MYMQCLRRKMKTTKTFVTDEILANVNITVKCVGRKCCFDLVIITNSRYSIRT